MTRKQKPARRSVAGRLAAIVNPRNLVAWVPMHRDTGDIQWRWAFASRQKLAHVNRECWDNRYVIIRVEAAIAARPKRKLRKGGGRG